MDFDSVSWLAAIVAAVVFFVLGAVWYGALFGKLWMRLTGMTDEKVAGSNMALLYGATLVLEFLAAVGLAAIIGEDPSLGSAALTGLAVGVLIAVAVLGVQAIFDRKPLALFLLNAGYNVAGFVAMGLVIGAIQ